MIPTRSKKRPFSKMGNVAGRSVWFLIALLASFAMLAMMKSARLSGYDKEVFVPASSALDHKGTPPFSLFVSLIFENQETLNSFKRDIAPLAQYIEEHEPDTLSYAVLYSDKEPLRIMVMERYRNKDAYRVTHKSSTEFLTFREKLNQMQQQGLVKIEGESYLDSGVGFGDRAS